MSSPKVWIDGGVGRTRRRILLDAGVFSMTDNEQLRQIVADLIEVMHLEAKELEKLIEHVEQAAGHLGYQHQFSVVASELSELHVRINKLKVE
jgi:hypothetical protein